MMDSKGKRVESEIFELRIKNCKFIKARE